MKKLRLFFSLFLLLASLTGCRLIDNITSTSPTPTEETKGTITQVTDYSLPDSDNPNGYKVLFDLGYGKTYQTTSTKNNYVLVPENPKRDFAKFIGWYKDNKEFNFNSQINSDITLIAKWDFDYPELVNYIYQNTIKASIKVIAKSFQSRFSTKYNEAIGSGIIIKEDSFYYYALTNHHVIYVNSNEYAKVEYSIVDCYGDEHDAQVLASSTNYDLALIVFAKSTSELATVKMAETSEVTETEVFGLGNPKSLINSISFGNTNGKKAFTPKEETKDKSYVTFDVIVHSAFINNGSSGGGLLNYNLELMGINFASSVTTTDEEFIRGYAIPIERVKEFLTAYYEKTNSTN